MKIVAMIGSLRKQSLNRSVFNYYRQIASAVEIIEGVYADFPIYNQDIQDKGFPPSVEKLGELIRESDGVLFFSPEYNYSIPGGLKNAVDWLSRLPNQPFVGKPASILSASPGRLGGARMQYQFRQVGVFIDLKLMNKPEVMISEAHKQINEHGELVDESTQRFLQKHLDAFSKFVQSK